MHACEELFNKHIADFIYMVVPATATMIIFYPVVLYLEKKVIVFEIQTCGH